jgi:hypothetical protein
VQPAEGTERAGGVMEPGSSENLKKLLESDLVFQKPCGFANGFSLSLSMFWDWVGQLGCHK